MLVYIINYITYYPYGRFLKNKKTISYLISAQLFLILVLRSVSVGWVDLSNYKAGYSYISNLSFIDLLLSLRLVSVAKLVFPFSYESGYVILNWLFAKVGCTFEIFLVFYSAFCILSIKHFIDQNSDIGYLSFALFTALGMYTYSFYVLRQTLAICILLFSVSFIKKRKIIPFLLIVFAAFTVHRISIIFMPLYFVYNLKVTKKLYIIVTSAIVVLLFTAPVLYRFVINPLLIFIGKQSFADINYSFNFKILLMLVIFAGIFVIGNFESLFDSDINRLAFYGFTLSIPIEILGMCNEGFARQVDVLFIFVIILIPNLISACAYAPNSFFDKIIFKKIPVSAKLYIEKHFSVIAETTVYIAFLIFYIYTLRTSYIVPYKAFWQ